MGLIKLGTLVVLDIVAQRLLVNVHVVVGVLVLYLNVVPLDIEVVREFPENTIKFMKLKS